MRPLSVPLKLSDIISDLEHGNLVIPDFQRDFVWDIERSASLLDSWIKGYPLGAFILWTTDEVLCKIKQIGNVVIYNQIDQTEKTTYILDGQQRITSIFAAVKGLTVRKKCYEDIVIDLDVEIDDYESDLVTTRDKAEHCISFSKLFEFDYNYIASNFKEYANKINFIRTKLFELDFPSIKVDDISIEVATDIFTRLNTGGKTLSPFEIISAKTYIPNEFNLVDKAKECRDNLNIAYKSIVSDSDIVKMIALCLYGGTEKKLQLKLTREQMIENFDAVAKALNSAISFCLYSLKIPVGNMFSYTPILWLYVYFYFNFNRNHKIESPSKFQQEYLIDYYWRCVLTGRFGRATDGKISTDAKNVIEPILHNKAPEQFAVSLNVESFVADGSFNTQSAYIKGLIGLLMSLSPKSLLKDSLVSFDQNWISKSDKNNYHHFFPQKMVGHTWTNEPINNICNIILQDASTNQIDIGNRCPSDYIVEFNNINGALQTTLEGHLIYDINSYGILNDDINLFVHKRASAFIEELKSRLKETSSDYIDSSVNINR